ncbi:hypothetical protein [Flavilitoribacter nigricans]|uniref:hypothetical protein n=1 Tax=Flavilitoribacter nigricans TaxID=70997 RepID=UPI001474B2E3|nr:hypothetical protein [Flavilitoribacter nigricans]
MTDFWQVISNISIPWVLDRVEEEEDILYQETLDTLEELDDPAEEEPGIWGFDWMWE